MGYLGLVPSEHTTGKDRQQGGITKMGNAPPAAPWWKPRGNIVFPPG
jgi:hypothetical protein